MDYLVLTGVQYKYKYIDRITIKNKSARARRSGSTQVDDSSFRHSIVVLVP